GLDANPGRCRGGDPGFAGWAHRSAAAAPAHRRNDDGGNDNRSARVPHAQARISLISVPVRLLPVPQLFASTPITRMAVEPTRVAGVPAPATCSPLLTRPPARPAVKAGIPS